MIKDINKLLVVEAVFTASDSIGENYTGYHRFAVSPNEEIRTDIEEFLKDEYRWFISLDDIIVNDEGSMLNGVSIIG